jgi:hypothetical protein
MKPIHAPIHAQVYKWLDELDGNHIGHPVLDPNGNFTQFTRGCVYILFRESHDGKLTWVDYDSISVYVVTDEYKKI